MSALEDLNARFALAGQLSFVDGPGGLVQARIENDLAAAAVTLYGAHVMTFQPRSHEPVLWLSPQTHFAVGKAIRGGVPVCWPWFAAHPEQATYPSHGFVRTQPWQVSATAAMPDGTTRLQLTRAATPDETEFWPHAYRLELLVTVGQSLSLSLNVHNPGQHAFTYTGALHTYFTVGDVNRINITGLDQTDYLDKVTGFDRKTQAGPVIFTQETDRIYLDTAATCVINDPVLRRRIHVAKSGSQTTVVWNPWAEKSAAMPDMGPDAYRTMVCVETANAADDQITVPPGASHHLQAEISVEALQ